MGAYYGLGLGLGGAPVPIRGSHIAVGGLIEQYPGAAAAYSLRALRNNIGNVVNVRRSSDDAEQAFTAQGVSDGTLVDWVNTNFNVKTYDFSLDAGGFGAPANITLEGGESIAGISDALKLSVVSTGSNTVHRTYENLTPLGTGSGLRISFKAYRPSSNVNAGKLGFSFTSGFLEDNEVGPQFFSEDDTWEDFIFNAMSGNSTRFYLELAATDGIGATQRVFNGTTGDHVYIKDLKIDVINSSGFVETWYDQSGNGRHATQTTAESQPKIVDGGALVTENGNPCIERHQNDVGLDLSWIEPSEVTTFSVSKLITYSGGIRATPVLFGGNYTYTSGRNSNNTIGMNHGQNNDLNFDLFFNGDKINQGILSAIAIPDYGEIWQNGTKGVDGDFGPGGDGSPQSYKLMQGGASGHGIGNISEFIIYPSDQSANRAAIEANLADQYGITLA